MRWLTIVGLILVGIPWSSRAGAAELSWARGFGGGSADLLYGVALDGNGDTLAVGEFSGTVDFDPGPGVTQLTADSGTAVFAIKLDADGALVWARKIDGTNGTHVRDLALDAAGALHLVGSFAATADFDPGPGTSLLTSAGLSDAYAVKLDSDGDLVWAVRWGNTANDSADAVAVAADGTVTVGGTFSGTVDFDPGVGTSNLMSAGSIDGYVNTLTAAGVHVRALRIGGAFVDRVKRLEADSVGRVVVLGEFQGSVDFDPSPAVSQLTGFGDSDVYAAKYATDGTLVFARRLGGTSTVIGGGLALDGTDGVYVTGYFAGTVDCDPGPGEDNLTSAGSADVFVARLDDGGNHVWARRVGGSGFDIGQAVAVVPPEGRVVVGGQFEGTVDFDPGSGTDSRTAPGNQADPFLLELDGAGTYVDAAIFSGTGTEIVSALDVDATGDLAVGGTFTGNPDFDPGPGVAQLGSLGSQDAFVARLGSPGGVAPDIQDVELVTAAARADGSVTTVYVFGASVVGDANLTDVTLTPPGGSPIPLAFDPVDGSFLYESAVYDTLAALRAAYPLGDYRLDFNSGSSFVAVGYAQTAPACFADLDSPGPGCVASTTPTLTWSLPVGCSAAAVDVGLDVAATDAAVVELSFVPASGGSFAYPDGPIVPTPVNPPPPLSSLTDGETYRLGVDVVDGTVATEFVNGDPFNYGAYFRNDADGTFVALGAGALVGVTLDGADLVLGCAPAEATGFDVVRGDVQSLRSGGFTVATEACIADDAAGPVFPLVPDPSPGTGWWYLARVVTVDGPGSFSSGGEHEAAGRDPAIAASSQACP